MPDETVFRFITQSQGGGGSSAGGSGGSAGGPPSPGPFPASAPGAAGAGGPGGSQTPHSPPAIPTPPPLPGVGVTPPPVIAPKPPPPPVTPPPIIPAGGGPGFGAGVSAVGQGAGYASMGAGQIAGGLAASLGVALPAIAAFAGALYIAKSAIETTFAAIGNATQQATPYSGALASAQANNELQQIMADIRTAQKLGGPLAEYESATGEMSRAIQEIRDAFLGEILQTMLPIMQVAVEILKKMAEHSGALTDAAKAGLTVIAPGIMSSLLTMSEIAKYFADKKEKEPDLSDPVFYFDAMPWASETDPVGKNGMRVDALAKGGKEVGGFRGADIDIPTGIGGVLK